MKYWRKFVRQVITAESASGFADIGKRLDKVDEQLATLSHQRPRIHWSIGLLLVISLVACAGLVYEGLQISSNSSSSVEQYNDEVQQSIVNMIQSSESMQLGDYKAAAKEQQEAEQEYAQALPDNLAKADHANYVALLYITFGAALFGALVAFGISAYVDNTRGRAIWQSRTT